MQVINNDKITYIILKNDKNIRKTISNLIRKYLQSFHDCFGCRDYGLAWLGRDPFGENPATSNYSQFASLIGFCF